MMNTHKQSVLSFAPKQTAVVNTQSLPKPTPCGDPHCLNGPPIYVDPETLITYKLDTYSLCVQCASAAPDPYKYGQKPIPSAWVKPKRKADDVAKEKRTRRSSAELLLKNTCIQDMSSFVDKETFY